MKKSSEPELLGEYYTYDPDKGKRVKRTSATIKSSFVFGINEFYLLKKGKYFVICIQKNGELYLVWKIKSEDLLPGEAISEFRKGYIKNGITQERLEFFLENPEKYDHKASKKQ